LIQNLQKDSLVNDKDTIKVNIINNKFIVNDSSLSDKLNVKYNNLFKKKH
jgi:hypothetical protein